MKVLKKVFLLLIVLSVGVLAWRIPGGVETDLYGFADSKNGGILRELASGISGQGRILLEGSDLAELNCRALEILKEFEQPPARDFQSQVKFLESRKSGLLAPATRKLLLEGRYHDVRDAALARLFSPAPPLFSVKGDPFLLATDYAMSLQTHLAEGWTLHDGFPVYTGENRVYLLLTLDLAAVDAVHLAKFLHQCEQENATSSNVKIWCGGGPFHSAYATESSKKEINVLSGVSLALVVLFGWLLFRSFRFLPRLLMAQMVGFLLATGALFLVFPRPHVLTFLFGTSLIGLSVDYVYHVSMAGGVRKVLRPMTLSLLTTVACFSPLMFAEVVVLRQMALFTIVGLLAVFSCVVLFFKGTDSPLVPVREDTDGNSSWLFHLRCSKPARILLLLIVLVPLLVGLHRVHLVRDLTAFYHPNAYLAASEKLLAEVSPGRAQRFAYVPGRNLQEALEKEEHVGIKGLSAVIPSLKRQRENAALVSRLYAAEGTNYTAITGLKIPSGEDCGFLDPEQMEDGPIRQMVRAMHVRGGLVSPLEEIPSAPADGWSILEPRVAMEDLFHRFTKATMKLLTWSLTAFVILLACVFRRRFLRFASPVLMSFLATAGALGWLGIPITFFTLLCFFVLAGLGIDYSIFHRGCPASETRRTVFFSFMTSFAGLGMLAFTDFAVTRSMGITFALGLFFAYVFSLGGEPLTMFPADGVGRGGSWHEQPEQSAGRWRMQFMWWMYAWFGKGLLKIVCIPVMGFIYPFAGPAKRALLAFYRILADFKSQQGPTAISGDEVPGGWTLYRHLLGFAWALVDKTDVCTLKKNLPRMTVREDAGWHAFRKLVDGKQGAFLVSTHLGTIEVLPALPSSNDSAVPHVHAFQQMGHDTVFTNVFMRHFDHQSLTLHAVEDIGVETAVQMQEAIVRGELVLMAGDRVSAGSGKVLDHDFLGRQCKWPKGVFMFAKLMESPVFFVTCVRTGWNAYECHFELYEGPRSTSGMLDRFAAFLQRETVEHPDQWYQFYDFFGNME